MFESSRMARTYFVIALHLFSLTSKVLCDSTACILSLAPFLPSSQFTSTKYFECFVSSSSMNLLSLSVSQDRFEKLVDREPTPEHVPRTEPTPVIGTLQLALVAT